MIPIPEKIAAALIQMAKGEYFSQSKLKGEVVSNMIADGVIKRKLQGRTKFILYADDAVQLLGYIRNHHGISDLEEYLESLRATELTRGKAVEVSSDSKLRPVRTFKGFLVNSYEPIDAQIKGNPVTIKPAPGTYTFIYDYEDFKLPPDITVVGVENSENFRFIEKQRRYFEHIKPLFVSRYPQGKDLARWLCNIPNQYLHFGDFDFEGIKIYLNEYKVHLGDKASFFIPENIGVLLQSYGNRKLYDKQFNRRQDVTNINENGLMILTELFNKYKKVLEQEILLISRAD